MTACPIRAIAARCVRAEGMLRAEIDAREALEVENRALRAKLAAVLGPKREVA
jgi:hypothetical protein